MADTGGMAFQDYALNELAARLPDIIIARLTAMFPVTEEQAAQFAPLVMQALIANYAGDEAPSAQTLGIIGGLIQSPDPLHTLGLILQGIWMDLPPYADNELILSLDSN